MSDDSNAGKSGGTGAEPPARRGSIGAKRNPDTETAILDAAERIIAAKGLPRLRMEAVAKEARAGKATLYKWWPTRGELLLAVYNRHKHRADYADLGSLDRDLTAVLDMIVSHWKTPEGRLFRQIIAEAQFDPDVAKALEGFRRERAEGLRGLFDRALARGEIPAGSNRDLLAEIVMGFLWQRLLTDRLDINFTEAARFLSGAWRR